MDKFKAAIFNNLSIFSKFYYGRIFNGPPNLLRLTLFFDLGNTQHTHHKHAHVCIHPNNCKKTNTRKHKQEPRHQISIGK